MGLLRPRILVSGTGPIADALLEGLRRAGRPARRLKDLGRPDPALPWAHVLLLTPADGRSRIRLDDLVSSCARRPRRLQPLRVILAHAGGAPTPLPSPPDPAVMTLETLDLEQRFARDLLARRPAHASMDPLFDQVPHLLIAGAAVPATALAVQAMRLAHYGERPSVFTFACTDPRARREDLLAKYPQAGELCRLRFTGLDAPDLDGQPPVTVAFVCLDPPEEGLETAHRLADRISRHQGVSPEIHLQVGGAEPAGDVADWDGQIVPFSWLREACRPEVWLDGRGDELAQVIHDHYRDSIAAQGRDPAAEPGGQPWPCLASSYRDANRHQADHLWSKLAVTDCRAVPEEQVESFAFAPLEVERLAVIEHARWAADRYLDGWAYAPVRDNARKYHPQLVPYDELSEPMKDLDRFAVRLVPTLLARFDRGVVRMLIVGLADADDGCPGDRTLARLTELAFRRLLRRYPDRSLVLASSLADVPARSAVRQALEQFGAGLILLCPRPIGETLAAQPDDHARRDLLDLAARAERRICLSGGETPRSWFARRAEILMLLGGAQDVQRPVKRIRMDTDAAEILWNFEY